MKTKMSKVLALAASAVLLVCMLAVGVTPASADVTYTNKVWASQAEATWTAADAGVGLVEGNNFYRFSAGAATDGEAIFDAGMAKNFRVFGYYGDGDSTAGSAITYKVSNDKSTWTDVTFTETIEDPEGNGWPVFTHTGSTTEAFKYLKVIITGSDYGWDPGVGYAEFDYAAPAMADSYAETMYASEATLIAEAGVELKIGRASCRERV